MIKLRVNGKEYAAGWTRARVTRGVDAVAGSFDLEVSERWANQNQPWPIREEDECMILVGDTVVITGYVDRRSLSYDATSHTLGVSGRDKTGDLVDCSAFLSKWEFLNIHVQDFVSRVTAPFDIPVTLQSSIGSAEVKKIPKVSIDPGDTAFDAIEKVCRKAGLLPISNGTGGLTLARAGVSRCKSELVQGQNILAAVAEYDASSRFHTYCVLGQHKGTDEFSGSQAAKIKATAIDLNVKRTTRKLVIRPEGNVTTEQAKKRAEWEACVRAGRSDSVTVTVQGWTQSNGALWPINSLVRVRSPLLGVDGDLLISQATYSLDDSSGTTTQLTLKTPNAYKPEPTITKASNIWKEIAHGA